MTRIVFLDRDTLPVTLPALAAAHDWQEYPTTATDEIIGHLQGAHIAITNKVPLTAETLAQLPDLRLIAVAATGYNLVDTAYCSAKGITVCNVRGYSTQSVAEHTLMQILALRRNLPRLQQKVQAGGWQTAPHFCLFGDALYDLNGATLSIIGRGATGQKVAQLAQAFGMRVLFAEHKQATQVREGYTPFAQALAQADVISLHCPLNNSTHGLISTTEFAQMQTHALLINNARGGIVDEPALAHALHTEEIAGAALDVLSVEPPRAGNVLLDAPHPNLLITPHVAWRSEAAMRNLATQLMQVIDAFLAGTPINVVGS